MSLTMTRGIITVHRGHGAMEILGIGIRGILPTIHGVGTHGAGTLIGLGHGALHGDLRGVGVPVGVQLTVPPGDRHGVGLPLRLGDRQLPPAHRVLIIT